MSQRIPTIIEDISWQLNTNYMGFASFTMLVWDHVDTFADEVEYIWKGKKGPIVYLFLVNRYLTPLGFIVNLIAYLSPFWTNETCDRFIRFEGAMTVTGINIVALMMFMRIHALYHRNIPVLVGVFVLLCVEFGVNAYLLTHGVRVHHNPESGVVACTMIFSPTVPGWLAASSAWLPLVYDTVILSLTVYRTLPTLKNKRTSYIMKRLFQDGLVYYSAIFAVTLVLTLMIVFAPPGIQNITAQLELLLTVAMMSRITINLKKSVHKVSDSQVKPEMPSLFTQKTHMEVDPALKIVAPGFNQTQTDTMLSDDYPGFHFSKTLKTRLSTIDESNYGRSITSARSPVGGNAMELATFSLREEPSFWADDNSNQRRDVV
ncbi:hypothetical protein FA15DRAFT_669631 [Coprinopsis marcescibilis]|uniref:DUF6533 domain-containing protein n=1 Tax=Coprinopsis marcescibilis TaxID=230819 RepID=A0A5C3KUS2_COPMA|nr:hypothetical protein FA15DRAFT_669631 [Coprinopsis marcescibilis]